MQGLELVLVRLASTVGSMLAKSVLTPKPGAGLVSDPVRPLPKPATPERLARVLSGRIASAYGSLPEHERLAAVAAVQDTFAAAAPLDANRLFAVDLDPKRLAAEVRRPVTDLSDRAAELYGELLGLCCSHVVEQLTAHASFPARAAVEQTRRAGRAEEMLRDLRGPRPEAVALDFEERYAEFVAATHSRVELFGITLGSRTRAEWSLDAAYISLAVTHERFDEAPGEEHGLPRTAPTAIKVERALADCGRLMLRGPAGAGKSTLVQWLALNAAKRSFGTELADWNRCVPFVLRLRSFNSLGSLPMPEDFLAASGVPLQPPAGWVTELLDRGRALVLVDGVDEVPMRLRSRTESWLRSLIAAFPNARYVVTTRPSAVPESWLTGQDFTAHSLLPMERDDIHSFIGHWHDSARRECAADSERELLDTYEAGLKEAVTTRRDLGRLATNPLMCALLCALNRDRRMQLPRARMELYDAALDMLLVRRDTEREVASVEGVTLSREEQTVLLQRLAYWLIRNGQVEASHDDAVEMLDEWLATMPRVREQGDAAKVFSHLLIRSGLLREPVPGYVDFVHRTFQDYLGAKAAVESRDFGVLVKNAHDDQWDDVVRMAVGHARVDERGRLLRQLLRRAGKVRRHRHRLVLLAAASLEHAAELDPVVRAEIEARMQELVPPKTLYEADELAKVGELVLELLPGPEGLDTTAASAVVRTAAKVGDDAGMAVIARFREDTRMSVVAEFCQCWSSFDARRYADTVLSATTPEAYVRVSTAEQLAELPRLPHLRRITLVGPHGLPAEILEHRNLEYLFVCDDPSLRDLAPLGALPHLTTLVLAGCPSVNGLVPLRGLGIEFLSVHDLAEGMSLAGLDGLADLRHLALGFAAGVADVAAIPVESALTGLVFLRGAAHIGLHGLERWPELKTLGIAGDLQGAQLASRREETQLVDLHIYDQTALDPATLIRHRRLKEIQLNRCRLTTGLNPLKDLPELTRLVISNAPEPLDLTPLAELENLTVHTLSGVAPVGTEHFPPERLNPRPD